MITFHELTAFLAHFEDSSCSCTEIEFRVNGMAGYELCWMGVVPERDDPTKHIYWYGLSPDGSKAYDYDTLSSFTAALVFDGHSLKDVWNNVELLSVDSCPSEERIRMILD